MERTGYIGLSERGKPHSRHRFGMAEVIGGWTAAATFVSGYMLPDLMVVTGLRGAEINFLLFAPAILLGMHFWKALCRKEVLPLTVVLLLAALSGLRSTHTQDAIVVALQCITALAFVSAIRCSRGFLTSSVATMTVVSLIIPAYVWWTEGTLLSVSMHFSQQMYTIFGTIYLAGRIPKRTVWLFAEIVMSTFRAAAIATAFGLVARAITKPAVRIVSLLIAVTLSLAISEYAPSGPSTGPAVREDLVGRFENIREDGGSGRADIWYAILEDVRRDVFDERVLLGRSLADVDYYVASLLPNKAVEHRAEPVLSSHNVFIEIFLGIGVVALPIFGWIIRSVVRNVRVEDGTSGLAVAVGVVSMANCTYELASGASLLLGLLFGLMGREPTKNLT